ncbi:MAG TPA: hypothetical protein VKQ30_05480 [Ktedonobacterales bacterium]|nr:hypothetical protein [Ktedonobacterales bacterium]
MKREIAAKTATKSARPGNNGTLRQPFRLTCKCVRRTPAWARREIPHSGRIGNRFSDSGRIGNHSPPRRADVGVDSGRIGNPFSNSGKNGNRRRGR